MKRNGSILLILILVLSLASLAIFAEERSIDLETAYVGSYYHQEATIKDVLAGTEYEEYAAFLVVTDIRLVSGEVPPGLDYDYTSTAVVFKGTPTTVGKYSFVVEVTGRAPILDRTEKAMARVNIEVKEGTAPDVTPDDEYEKPQFVTEPLEIYEVNKGGSVSVQVSAKCAQKCNFTLYVQNGNGWKALAETKNVNSCTLKPKTDQLGTFNYKVVAVNTLDATLKTEKTFVVKVTSTVTETTSATVTGATEYSVGNAINLVCNADGTSPTYIWYIKRTTDSSFKKLTTNTGKVLSFTLTEKDDGAEIKCVVGKVTSNVVKISVKAAHTHSYGAWTVIKAPTCTVAGLETRTCSCTDAISRAIPPTGHTPASEWTVDVKQTCITSGARSIRCTVCNDKVREETLTATGHSFTEWKVIKSPTTVEDGIETRSCKNCSATETQTIPKKDGTHNHAYSDWVVEKEATCTQDGLKTRKCSCGFVQSATVSAEGHKYSTLYTVITAPTCTDKGQKAKKCLGCNEYSARTEIEALGHKMGVAEVVIHPTYESAGLEVQKCTNTGCKYYVEKTIAKLVSNHAHLFSEWTISTASGCTSKGVEKRSCSCGEVETNEIEARGHIFGVWEVTLAPTATRDGVETRKCTECTKAERRVIPKGTVVGGPSGTEEPTTPEPTPTVTPTLTPDGTDGTTQAPDTNTPQTGTNNDPTGGEDKTGEGLGDFAGFLILMAVALILGVVLYCTVKIFLKNT